MPTNAKRIPKTKTDSYYMSMGIPIYIYRQLEKIRKEKGLDSVQALLRMLAAKCIEDN